MIAFAEMADESPTVSWQEGFLEMLPLIERHARIALSSLDAEAREDAICEVVANAMCAYRQLHERNELDKAFASALARFAVAQFHGGRRVGTRQCSHDVFSAKNKRRSDFEIRSFGCPGEMKGAWLECLHDNRLTPVFEQVAFRLDFPRWLKSQSWRNQQIVESLAIGNSTNEVAKQFSISPARVSQIRRELAESWNRFANTECRPEEDMAKS